MPPKTSDQREMSITAHLAELRQRLIKCLLALGAGFAVSFYFVDGLLAVLKRPSPAELYFLSPTEAFWMSLEIAFFAGLFLSLPVILYQLWKFIAPGLLLHERKYVAPFLVLGVLFFSFGLLFCYFIVLPFALTFLMDYGAGMGLKPLLSIGSYIDFLLKFLLAFGLVFELPLAITLLARMGLMTPEFLSRNRKYAVLLNAVAAAILTPTSDVFNMMLMMIPLLIFYELGILGAKLFGRKRSAVGAMNSEAEGKVVMLALVILAALLGPGRPPAFGAEVTEPFRYIQARPQYRPPADRAVTLYRTNGPGGYAGIQSIAIGKDNTIYVGTYGLGIYKNRKGESTWKPLTRGLKDYYIHSLFIDSDGTLYAGTIRQGAFKSADGGEHWAGINQGLSGAEVEVITMGPRRLLYAGTNSGVFISRDLGKSWSASNDGIRQILVRTIAFGDNAIYIGSAGMGAYRSLDQGKNWEQIHQGMVEGDEYPENFIRTMVMDKNGTLYAGTFDGGVFASKDGGRRWKPLNKGLTNTSIRGVLVDSKGLLFVGTGRGVFMSRDGGDHWTFISEGQEDVSVQTMALGPDDAIYIGTNIGLYSTRDQGRHWEFLSQNLTTPVIPTILVVGPDRDLYAASQGLGVLRSQDHGLSWGFAKEGLEDDFIQSLVQDSSGVLYAGTESGVFKSTDKGKNWTSMNEGLAASNGITVHRMLHHRHGFFVVTDAGPFRWEPGQNRWVSLESDKVPAMKIHAITVDNDRTVYLGTEHGIFKKEGGSGWTALEPAPGGGPGDAPFVANALLWTDEHGLFAAGPSGLSLGKRKSDRGLIWEAKGTGLPQNATIHVLAQDPQRPSLIYAGTSHGLFLSQNGGDQWEQARIHGEDAGLLDIRSIEFQPDGMLFVGTADAGVLVGINRLPAH